MIGNGSQKSLLPFGNLKRDCRTGLRSHPRSNSCLKDQQIRYLHPFVEPSNLGVVSQLLETMTTTV